MTESAQIRQIVGRRWNYAPPPTRMFEALVDEWERWLEVVTGETTPVVIEATRPSRVVFRPWLDFTIDSVTVEIGDDGGQGSSLRILATATAVSLSDDERRWVRYRLGTIFGAALRHWVDEPHY